MPTRSPTSPITFVVAGQDLGSDPESSRGGTRDAGLSRLPAGLHGGTLKHSVQLRATRAGATDVVPVSAVPGTDVVVIQIANGPTLVLHPETARDLLLAQGATRVARGESDTTPAGAIPVVPRLQWEGLEDASPSRGERGLGGAIMSGFHVVSDLVKGPAADFAAEKIAKRFDEQVTDGVYQLDSKALPKLKTSGRALPASSVSQTALVLIHGTFSTTDGTFQKLWTHHPDRVDALFDHYENRVYALDHSTLGESPIDNALTLAKAVDKGTRLHLATHSRGGLVAEVLAKVCGNPTFKKGDLAVFDRKGYEGQVEALKELSDLVQKRRIRVERVVRVACPVRGTLLASKRLDAYLSVFKWGLELAGVPVAPALVDFLSAVAQRRADPMRMPGLAAQIPDSPLVQWLHADRRPIGGDLRVIAGDLAGDSVTSWVKTLLATAFYWTDNDLVVQTRGMYGGARRAVGATFLLDQGGEVSHFNYFSNDRSADAIVSALTQATPKGFQSIGDDSWSGVSATGLRDAPDVAPRSLTAGDRPLAVLVPDAFASHLKIGDDRVWLGPSTPIDFARLTYRGRSAPKVVPDGILQSAYGDLANYLSATHEVIEFAYDWRKPIAAAAVDLATAVGTALTRRGGKKKSDGPVRIIAHGMGGLLVRALQLAHRDMWDRMLAHADSHVLLLGVPNAGSWTPMQVLSGDETLGGLLLGLGKPMEDGKAREILAGFPGFLQLQAGLDGTDTRLTKHEHWATLASDDLSRVPQLHWHSKEQGSVYQWGVPGQDVLDLAIAFRRQLQKQAATGFGQHARKMVSVVGTGRSTPDGYDGDANAFTYVDVVGGGDGYVTTKNAMLPGVATWVVTSDHAGLTTNKENFDAYLELLKTGQTKRLASLAASSVSRGADSAEARESRRPSRELPSLAAARKRDLLGVSVWDEPLGSATTGPALPITVTNGNLRFVHQPLMLGHYRSLKLTGTERVMDDLIGKTMSQLVALRQYPDRPTSTKIFRNRKVSVDNPWQRPRPEAVIVVGLGEEGKLTTTELTATVSQGVIAWAQRLTEDVPNAPPQFELAATLLGSGGAGVSAAQAAMAIAQGVREANLRLIEVGLPSVGHLYLIELYLDRASEAWRALRAQAVSSTGQYQVDDIVTLAPGALRRPIDSSYRGAEYDFVTATTQLDAQHNPGIAFRLDTKRARTEVHAQAMQGPLLRDLVSSASNARNTDTQIGRTLFQLLIPAEMEPFLGGTTSLVLELDPGSAGIPWELLDSGAGTRNGEDRRPWAIRSKLLRKLRTDDYRAGVIDADADAHILVIGEPKCPDNYERLAGAREEAAAVVSQFRVRSGAANGSSSGIKDIIADEDRGGADARTIMNAVLERDWRIVHIAGHGQPPEKIGPLPVKADDPPQRDGNPRGVVLSNGAFLGPREINTMRVVPELVFVNCCHLGARNIGQLGETNDTPDYDRAKFAAGVAESLIKIGVRCVIAAGWAVGDVQAKTFATTFYRCLLDGTRFIDAVAEARQAAYKPDDNTWAAYQCYGDPDWTFRWQTGDAQAPTTTTRTPGVAASGKKTGANVRASKATDYGAEFGAVASPPTLVLALETLATRCRYDDPIIDVEQKKIRHLEGRFGERWGDVGRVAEAFGNAWHAAHDRPSAIAWYERAVAASDASATMKATEQLGNLRAREAEATVTRVEKRIGPRRRGGKKGGSRGVPAELRSAIDDARREIDAALGLLTPLAERHPSAEREGLCGSAWKRRAMIETKAGDANAAQHALVEMRKWYARATDRARKTDYRELYYPALNLMAADLILSAPKGARRNFDPGLLEAVQANIDARTSDSPDFWTIIAGTELRLYKALAHRDLETDRDTIQSEYTNHWERVRTFGDWDSVITQLDFVLATYAEHATAAERTAANGLRAFVRQLVGAPPHSATP